MNRVQNFAFNPEEAFLSHHRRSFFGSEMTRSPQYLVGVVDTRGDDPARQRLGRTLRRPTLRISSRVVTVSTEVFSSGNCSAKQGFAIAKRLRNWSFARKFPVVEQPKCGAKNIPRIFRRGQTSSGLPPVNSSFGSIWKLFQIDPLRHHGDHPP